MVFTKCNLQRAYKAKDIITYKKQPYFSRRKAADYVGVSMSTLYNWANIVGKRKRRGCPWLDGDAIDVRVLPGAIGQEFTYFSQADLDRVIAARRARGRPDYPGLTSVDAAKQALSLSHGAILRRLREQVPPERVVRKRGCLPDGRACHRAYIRTAAVTKMIKAAATGPPAARMTVKKAAAELGVSVDSVRLYGNEGRLDIRSERVAVSNRQGKDGRAPCCYQRRGCTVSRESVERLRQEMRAVVPPDRMTVKEAATRLGLSEPSIHRIAAGIGLDMKRRCPRTCERVNTVSRDLVERLRQRREGTLPPVREEAQDSDPEPEPDPAPGPPQKKKRGRPKGRIDPEVASRNRQMQDDWSAGKFSTKAALARAYHVTRQTADAVLNRS